MDIKLSKSANKLAKILYKDCLKYSKLTDRYDLVKSYINSSYIQTTFLEEYSREAVFDICRELYDCNLITGVLCDDDINDIEINYPLIVYMEQRFKVPFAKTFCFVLGCITGSAFDLLVSYLIHVFGWK